MSQIQGIALRCDAHGAVADILHNPPELGIDIAVGMPFARLAAEGSLAKALSFLIELTQKGLAYDWEINVTTKHGIKTLRFAGGGTDEHIIVGAEEAVEARQMRDELIRMGNEQANRLRASIKREAVHGNLYDEISRLNNELVTLQRRLAKQNAELQRLCAETERMAKLDTLTGVYNRFGLYEAGGRELERAIRFKRPLTAIIFDLDNFKSVNDTYGHAGGDVILQETARRCSHLLRRMDVFGRYGGDEFATLLPETTLDMAVLVADRLRSEVQVPILVGDCSVNVTASFGVAAHSAQIATLGDLMRRADQALYAAKGAGGNCVRKEDRDAE